MIRIRKSTVPKNGSSIADVQNVRGVRIARALLLYALTTILISFAMAEPNSTTVTNVQNDRRQSGIDGSNVTISGNSDKVLPRVRRDMPNDSTDKQDEQGVRWRENRQRRRRGRRLRKSIWNAVIESARCEHVELMDCEEYETDEMRCMVTATGMPCCVCSGRLKTLSARIRRRYRSPAS